MGQSQVACKHVALPHQSGSRYTGGLKEGRESCQRVASSGVLIIFPFPLSFVEYTPIHTEADECVCVCACINVIITFLCLIKRNSVVNTDHILHPHTSHCFASSAFPNFAV